MPFILDIPNRKNIRLLNIPEGYLVESVPKPIKIATVENVGLFIFNVLPEGKRIQISFIEEIKCTVSSDFYEVKDSFIK
jgi:hypothetical protein